MSGETHNVTRYTWDNGELSCDTDVVVTEVPVALVYNGVSHVVMMATPTDLHDLALGFSLSESILESPSQLLDCELTQRDKGIELTMTITAEPFMALKARRRNLTGRTGCGLCGVESLEQAIPVPKRVERDCTITHEALQQAIINLDQRQSLKRRTGAVHGAAWCSVAGDIELLREDVGRHNALDKLLGALRGSAYSPEGFVLVTSRASYEMVAKVASCDIALLAAVSAPTSLAIDQAQRSGLTLVGFVQPGRQVIYTYPERIQQGS